jgi:hypothetical protein
MRKRWLQVLGAVVLLRHEDRLLVSADGHYGGTPNVERLFSYVVLTDSGEQVTLTPEEFAARYHWKNDPSQVRLAPEPASKQTSVPPTAGGGKP